MLVLSGSVNFLDFPDAVGGIKYVAHPSSTVKVKVTTVDWTGLLQLRFIVKV